MANYEVKKLFEFRKGRYLPCGLNIVEKAWWRFMPGTIINVKWPKGMIVAGPGPEDPRWCDLGGASYVTYESADPNDHYRPWLEKHVGRQGWDWNWGLVDMDATENRLTIKIRQKHKEAAIMAKLQWS
jgi:hypothetical protein